MSINTQRGGLTPHDIDARFRTANASGLTATNVLGVPVSLVNPGMAVDCLIDWATAGTAHFVCIRDVHGIMRAQEDPALMALHQQAGMVTPDGMPLVWIARARGHVDVLRTSGTDLLDAVAAASVSKGLRHYFYGGKPGVAERVAAELGRRHPGMVVAGWDTPPFRPLTPEEDANTTSRIAATTPHFVWVGLSTPTQEFWMRDHVGRVPGAVLLGVGAAFDFVTGDVRRAPRWMQRGGLEWLHRLASEPRRLWRRYLVLAPKFVAASLREHGKPR